MDLAKKYIEYIDDPRHSESTFNDFFDWVGIPMKNRTNFAVAAILKNVRNIILDENNMCKISNDIYNYEI